MPLDDWKPVVDIFAGLTADEQDILFTKLNNLRELHVTDDTLRANVGDKDAPAAGTLLDRLEQIKTEVSDSTAIVEAVETLQQQLKGAGDKDLTTVEAAIAQLQNRFDTVMGDAVAVPGANTVQDRLQRIIDTLGEDVADTLLNLLQTATTNIGDKDTPDTGTLLERLNQIKEQVQTSGTNNSAAIVNAITTLQTQLKGAGDKDLTTLEAAIAAFQSAFDSRDLAKDTTLVSQLDITLSALRDALRGGSSKTLSDIWNSLQTQREISTSLWTDDSGATYVRRDTVDESDGTVTVTFTDELGNSATPGAGLRPLASTDKETVESLFTATAAGTGYSDGDILARVLVIDTSVTPPDISATWMNVTEGTTIAAPSGGTYDQNIGLTDDQLALRLGASTDPAATGNGTLIAINKRVRDLLQELRDRTSEKELTERMLNKQPALSKRLWFDTANTSHLYTLEADAANAAGDTGFRGIRVTIDISGNPVGKVEVNSGGTLTFDNRTTDGGWS